MIFSFLNFNISASDNPNNLINAFKADEMIVVVEVDVWY